MAYAILHLLHSQLGSTTTPHHHIMIKRNYRIHTTSTKYLQDLSIPTLILHKSMETFSQNLGMDNVGSKLQ